MQITHANFVLNNVGRHYVICLTRINKLCVITRSLAIVATKMSCCKVWFPQYVIAIFRDKLYDENNSFGHSVSSSMNKDVKGKTHTYYQVH